MRRRNPDYRKLARYQRWLLWLVLGNLLLQLAPFVPWIGRSPETFVVIAVLTLMWVIPMLITVVLVLRAEDNNVLVVILSALCMLAPCANLLCLLLINMSATRTLRRAGIRVGFMGANDEDVEMISNPDLCKGCGYNLTGNVSGICPECGRPVGV